MTSRSGQPCSGSSGSPFACVASSACSSRRKEIGTFAVKPCSAWAIAKRALGFGRTSASSSRQWTPSKVMSNFDQRVTQWMSCVCSVLGSAFSSSQESVTGFSTSPKTSKSQVARSVDGTEPGVEDGPLLGQVLAGREARRVVARVDHLLLGLGAEDGTGPTLVQWRSCDVRGHGHARRRVAGAGRRGVPAADGLERRRRARAGRILRGAAPDAEGARDRAARRLAPRATTTSCC